MGGKAALLNSVTCERVLRRLMWCHATLLFIVIAAEPLVWTLAVLAKALGFVAPPYSLVLILRVFGLFGSGVVAIRYARKRADYEALTEHSGTESCRFCGYLLHGLNSLSQTHHIVRCPECGDLNCCSDWVEPAEIPNSASVVMKSKYEELSTTQSQQLKLRAFAMCAQMSLLLILLITVVVAFYKLLFGSPIGLAGKLAFITPFAGLMALLFSAIFFEYRRNIRRRIRNLELELILEQGKETGGQASIV